MSRFCPGQAVSISGRSTHLRMKEASWTCLYESGAGVCDPRERWTMWRASTEVGGGGQRAYKGQTPLSQAALASLLIRRVFSHLDKLQVRCQKA